MPFPGTVPADCSNPAATPPAEYPLTPDPLNPGLFFVPPGFAEDPVNPGLWLLDGSVTYYLIESPAGSGLLYLALTDVCTITLTQGRGCSRRGAAANPVTATSPFNPACNTERVC